MTGKVLGSLCVLSAAVLGRWLQQREARRRRETLLDLTTALRRMAETVRLARTPLPSLLEGLAQDCGRDTAAFLTGAASAAREGEALPERWRALAQVLPLEAEDRRVLAELGRDLQGDEGKVCRAVTLTGQRLAQRAEAEERARPEAEKRAAALWFSGAALLVILLI